MSDPGPYPAEGTKAPSFTMVADNGEKVSLSDFRGKKVVLYFYPEDDTPGCTKESCSFRDHHAEILARGAVVLGVSRDGTESHVKFKRKYGLPFLLLTDADGAVCQAYGVWQKKTFMGKTYMGIARTTFVVGADGRIQKVFPKVNVDAHTPEVLAALDAA
ncbi:MAG TPA: thioredoxin-dependent thiol peroxidase [Candidatus Thermoplasmatota archaeon]|nr:thioredoxin-dependent thiol peroxidase [Candidatus Thermoplasmatota archaeon]